MEVRDLAYPGGRKLGALGIFLGRGLVVCLG